MDPLKRVIGILAFLLLPGCALLKGMEEPHADGSWVGRIMSVKVQDDTGREFDAALLDIESGPYLPFDPPEGAGAGRKPLLARMTREGGQLWDPAMLPMGKRVRVRGTSALGLARIATPSDTGVRFVHRPVLHASNGTEHLLIIEHNPHVLGD